MSRRPLRIRFVFWVAELLTAVLAGFGLFIYVSVSQELRAAVDDSLRLSASQVLAMARSDGGKINLSGSFSGNDQNTAELREHGLTIRMLNPAGDVVQAFGPFKSLQPSGASSRSPRFATMENPATKGAVRFYIVPITDNGRSLGTVQVAQSLYSVGEALEQLLTSLLIGGPLVILLGGLGGYLLVSRALAPIASVTQTARRISAENLSARMGLPPSGDEVGLLASTFDEMLARLHDSFLRERQFTSDASHELRTPLMAMQTILSVMRERRRTAEDYEKALADLSEVADRQRTLVENLLVLARSDMQKAWARGAVDLSGVLRDVAASMQPLVDAKGLAFSCAIPDDLSVTGDSDGLTRAFMNLLDNAVKYTDAGKIVLEASSMPREIIVTVLDTGIGIAPEHIERIFDRFYRVDASRSSGGVGLGLSIVREIIKAHGGSVVVSSLEKQGSVFTVHLPK